MVDYHLSNENNAGYTAALLPSLAEEILDHLPDRMSTIPKLMKDGLFTDPAMAIFLSGAPAEIVSISKAKNPALMRQLAEHLAERLTLESLNQLYVYIGARQGRTRHFGLIKVDTANNRLLYEKILSSAKNEFFRIVRLEDETIAKGEPTIEIMTSLAKNPFEREEAEEFGMELQEHFEDKAIYEKNFGLATSRLNMCLHYAGRKALEGLGPNLPYDAEMSP